MSAELHDFRGKLTTRTHCALEARSQATGKDRAEIVREILDAWAADELHAAMVLHRNLLAQGLPGIGGGMPGNAGESQGIAGRTRP
jgi:hypothetical protein